MGVISLSNQEANDFNPLISAFIAASEISSDDLQAQTLEFALLS